VPAAHTDCVLIGVIVYESRAAAVTTAITADHCRELTENVSSVHTCAYKSPPREELQETAVRSRRLLVNLASQRGLNLIVDRAPSTPRCTN
jgi:hypothetical protein